MPAPATPKPITWPTDLYRLVELGEGPPGHLAACVRHQGQHVFYLGGCHALPPHGARHRDGGRRSQPEPVVRVEITNVDDFREALERRRERGERDVRLPLEPKRPTPSYEREPSPTPPPTVASNDVPTIPVWTPDDSAE